MTQTIDPTKANIEKLTRWLAEQPCQCDSGVCRKGDPIYCSSCFPPCDGLAFSWASEECSNRLGCPACVAKPKPLVHDALIYARGHVCNGSGRVPKAVGLEELMELYPDDFWNFTKTKADGEWRVVFRLRDYYGETPLLAALRAVVLSGQA